MRTITVAAVALAFSSAAAAGDFRFNYSAEDLLSPEQVEALHARLEASADSYCESRYRNRMRVAQMCTRMILEDATRQIGNPNLTAYQEDGDQPRG